MKIKSFALAVMAIAVLASPSLAVLEVIIDEDFDNYNHEDNFLEVNPNTGPNWASTADEPGAWWRRWVRGNCLCTPDVTSDLNTSPPNSLSGLPDISGGYTNWLMLLYLPEDRILNETNGAGDATLSFDVLAKNPLESELRIQIADGKSNLGSGPQDRFYFCVGGCIGESDGGGWTFSSLNSPPNIAGGEPCCNLFQITTDVKDFNGNPMVVPHGEGGFDIISGSNYREEQFLHVKLTFDWDPVNQTYGKEYGAQIFELDGVTALTPVNTFAILDADSRDDGEVNGIAGMVFSSRGHNHGGWIDNLLFTADRGGAGLPCDFDNDSLCNDVDIDLLAAAVRNGTSDPKFNVDGIGGDVPDDLDFAYHITDAAHQATGFGDVDLNKMVNFVDFVGLSNAFGMTGTGWATGNFNTDDLTNFVDFVALSNNFGMNFASDAVPEPSAAAIVGIGVLGLVAGRNKMRK